MKASNSISKKKFGSLFAAVLSLLSIHAAYADSEAVYWTGKQNNSWGGMNWSNNTSGTGSTYYLYANLPYNYISDPDVIFSSTGASNQSTNISGLTEINSLTINDPKAVTIDGSIGNSGVERTLTIDAFFGTSQAITVNDGAGLATISSNLILNGGEISVNNDAGLVLSGTVNNFEGANIVKVGAGTLTLTGAANGNSTPGNDVGTEIFSGILAVQGSGGNLNTGGLSVNGGNLQISNGGQVTENGNDYLATLGYPSYGTTIGNCEQTGLVEVTGANANGTPSTFTGTNATVGGYHGGLGTLNVLDGGQVNLNNISIVGSGTVNVSGSALEHPTYEPNVWVTEPSVLSAFVSTAEPVQGPRGLIQVGSTDGPGGVLNIQNGGWAVDTAGLIAGIGSVTVSGSGASGPSLWATVPNSNFSTGITEPSYLEIDDGATLTIANGGMVTTPELDLSKHATGSVTINLNSGGELEAGSIHNFSSSTTNDVINFNGGILQDTSYSSSETLALGGINLRSGGGTIDLPYSGNSIVINALISGAGELTKTGAGTLTLDGINTYSGGTQIDGGLLIAETNASLGTGPVSFAGGLLQYGTGSGNGQDISGQIHNSAQAIAVATTSSSQTTTYASGIDSSNTGGLIKSGSGTLILGGNNTYTGGTTVSGGTLAVNGSVAGNVTVKSGAQIGGSGTIAGTIGGSGSVGPGDAPGILTAGSTDPTGGLTYNFQFTQAGAATWSNAANSGNDVLHLNLAVPFTAPLTSANDLNIYFAQAETIYVGGFFINGSTDNLTANIADATLNYYLLDNTNGTVEYEGNMYDRITGQIVASTVQVTGANFSDGTVNGYAEQFNVGNVEAVPEPSTWALLLGGLGLLAFWHHRTRREHV